MRTDQNINQLVQRPFNLVGPTVTRTIWGAMLGFSLLGFGACTPYTPPPLTTAHPAYLEAATVPEPPPSMTLAYGKTDIPTPQPAVAMAQYTAANTQSSKTFEQAVVGEGSVIAVVPSSQQIVIDHGDIKGFMDAMTMGFRVDSPALLSGVKAGDKVRFTIDLQKNAIVKIEPKQMEGFIGEGKVIAVVPNTQQVVIDHGDIKGFMDAMTMGFRVVSPSLLEGLKAGDQIRFTIGAQENAIVQIEKMGN